MDAEFEASPVDRILAARLGPLCNSFAWPALRPLLHALIGRKAAIALCQSLAPLDSRDVFEWLIDRLELKLTTTGLEQIPRYGPCLAVANHPTGAADGVALYQALRPHRPDICFFSSVEALEIAPGLAPCLIPVQIDTARRTPSCQRALAQALRAAIRAERLIVLLPAGALSLPHGAALRDPPWAPTPVQLARRFELPVIPIHIAARNSALHYALLRLSPRLRDLTVFRELVNKRRTRFRVTIGTPIPADRLPASDIDAITQLFDEVHQHLAQPTALPE